MLDRLKLTIADWNNVHRQGARPNVFIFSAPRSGSTWLMELVLTQPGFKRCNEPFNLRHPRVRDHLGRFNICDWDDLHEPANHSHIDDYLGAICAGSLGIHNPFLYRNRFRLFTNRVVFKILHAEEDRVGRAREGFNGRAVVLIRHPIPVSLSRKKLPRLSAFVSSAFARHFTDDRLELARRIIASGTRLEQAMLDWSLQNAVALNDERSDRLVVTYEQLVLDPLPVMGLLAERLDLPLPERMTARLGTPSSSTSLSDDRTRETLKSRAGSATRWLVEKWRERVGEDEERRLMEIPARFGIEAYVAGETLPSPRFWIGGDG